MTELFITSSILIVVIAFLRFLLKNKLSRRLRYALWGLVVIRLMLPFQLFSSPIAAVDAKTTSAVQSIAKSVQVPVRPYELYTLEEYAKDYNIPIEQAQVQLNGTDLETASIKRQTVPLETLLKWIWIGGAAVAAVWFFIKNTVFYIKLLSVRVPIETGCKLKVYRADFLHSPCLFGLFRPAIYLNEKALADENTQKSVLTHELCHYAQGDHLWSFVRCVLLAVYWFDPFVWMAAAMSRTDCELACDEAAVKKLGEENRIAYGKALVGMIEVKQAPVGLTCAATTMVSGKRGIKERVKMIANNRKTRVWAAVLLALVMMLAIGCTFGTDVLEKGIVTDKDMKIDKLEIGMTMEEVKAIYGEPTETFEFNSDELEVDYHYEICHQWRYDEDLILNFCRFEEGENTEFKLVQIGLRSDKYALPNGLTTGAKMIEVTDAYSWDENCGHIIFDYKNPEILMNNLKQSAYFLYGGFLPEESDAIRTEAAGTAYVSWFWKEDGLNESMVYYVWCPEGSTGKKDCYSLRFNFDPMQKAMLISIRYYPTIYEN